MDSVRKRKASDAAALSSSEGVASKKIRLLNTSHASNAESQRSDVQKVGTKLLGMLHNAKDKTCVKLGRSIVDVFLTLPPADELPDYYEIIKLPIAIDTIEEKLDRNEYSTITALESDLKRMVQNAKDYNEPRSEVYEDAERIRKLVYNYMKINNPQYRLDPSYTSFPTPIPGERAPAVNGTRLDTRGKPASNGRSVSVDVKQPIASNASEPLSERKSSMAPSATTGDGDGDDPDDEGEDDNELLDFTGKSFQQAQKMIISELIDFTDDEGLEIFTPFVNLPSRKLEDYYKIIKNPVSLKSVQKRIQGQHGRAPPTGITDFKSWDALEEEVRFIWRNAQEYNEDGSEMFELAGEFEKLFKGLLAQAKQKVEEPAAPRIKIGAPKPKSGITLNLTQHRPLSSSGFSVDNDALSRQRQMVQAGVDGKQTEDRPTPPTSVPARLHSHGPDATAPEPDGSDVAPSPSSTAIKTEKLSRQSPMPSIGLADRPMTNGVMAPPGSRPPSGSPYLQQAAAAAHPYPYVTAAALPPPTAIRTYPRHQALLPLVTIATHPHLQIPRPYTLAIPPHVSLSHHSATITLPSTHHYLQISPTVSRELSMGRAYKIFVSINGSRLTQRDTQFNADTGTRTHGYEGSLVPGVNRIEVEVAAAKLDGGGGGENSGLDVEKLTVFANVMK